MGKKPPWGTVIFSADRGKSANFYETRGDTGGRKESPKSMGHINVTARKLPSRVELHKDPQQKDHNKMGTEKKKKRKEKKIIRGKEVCFPEDGR